MSTTLSEEEKQLLERRYDDLEFVEGIEEELRCGRCQRLTIHHFFSQCGHVFCANCRKILIDGPSICPKCNAIIDEQKEEFEQRIYAVKVACPNKKYGCSVVNTLQKLPGHLRQCKDTAEVKFPIEAKLDEVMKTMLLKFEEVNAQMNFVANKIDLMGRQVLVRMNSQDTSLGQLAGLNNFDINGLAGQQLGQQLGSLGQQLGPLGQQLGPLGQLVSADELSQLKLDDGQQQTSKGVKMATQVASIAANNVVAPLLKNLFKNP